MPALTPRDLSVVIDYAHTPDALENVLKTLRDVAPDRELICLFGCGGDRDKTKRPEMGAVAGRLADRIFLTSDNSRSERTEDILEDIRRGMDPAATAKTVCIADRREATSPSTSTTRTSPTRRSASRSRKSPTSRVPASY